MMIGYLTNVSSGETAILTRTSSAFQVLLGADPGLDMIGTCPTYQTTYWENHRSPSLKAEVLAARR